MLYRVDLTYYKGKLWWVLTDIHACAISEIIYPQNKCHNQDMEHPISPQNFLMILFNPSFPLTKKPLSYFQSL